MNNQQALLIGCVKWQLNSNIVSRRWVETGCAFISSWKNDVKPGKGSVLGISWIGSVQAFCFVWAYLCGIAWCVWEDDSGFPAVLWLETIRINLIHSYSSEVIGTSSLSHWLTSSEGQILVRNTKISVLIKLPSKSMTTVIFRNSQEPELWCSCFDSISEDQKNKSICHLLFFPPLIWAKFYLCEHIVQFLIFFFPQQCIL